MYDIITIVGNVATDPTQGRTANGVAVTNFRVASTHRRFDESTQTWVDVVTNWYSVAAFRQLGENAKASIRAGDSVIVTGKVKIRAWENNGRQGTSVDIDADAIGHDLRWGTTAYRRNSRSAATEHAPRSTSSPEGAAPAPDARRSAPEGDRVIETPWVSTGSRADGRVEDFDEAFQAAISDQDSELSVGAGSASDGWAETD
ncbi:single-stranded DNA-binding protein [Microbacterium sp. H83]|uniref:single-stranded DNA-binding protein n=1 Tax=Microbacterium sp. H83 TaxID=1827324 RepID=UPI0009EF02EC|nr:single-stranded DNA-binding protein [Microbacterium sp. H83]